MSFAQSFAEECTKPSLYIVNMYKYLLISVTFLEYSCAGDQEQRTISNKNDVTWKQEIPGRINNAPTSAETEKSISTRSTLQLQNEPDRPMIEMGEWGRKYGESSFLHSRVIDSLVNQKNKKLTAYNFQSDGWVSTINVLGEKFLSTLPAKELTYYCLSYPAYFSQNCSAFPIPEYGKTYFAQFLSVERHISAVQTHCIHLKRDSVFFLLKKLIRENDTVHIEVLDLIHRANLVEMIPLLCDKASFNKNPYIYTLFINLMNSNHYAYFSESKYYNRLLKNIHPSGALMAKKADADSILYYTRQFYTSYFDSTTP